MANTSKLLPLLLLLLFYILHRGVVGAPCDLSDIKIQQQRTGVVVEGMPEYEVTMSNGCHKCSQSKVVIRCNGLSSVEAVDRHAIQPIDDERCIIAEGQPILWTVPVKFKYAWMTPRDFLVLKTQINC